MKAGSLITLTLIIKIFLSSLAYSIPPKPPLGYRWVINQDYSDEFNGIELNTKKWNDFYPGWEGRPPAMFIPEAINVQNGFLKIHSGVLEKPVKDYTLFGGAVTSKKKEAHFGYYEVRAKASQISMSTTFWLSNGKVPYKQTEDCKTDSYSQELDIQECVGGGDSDRHRNGMNSNTHYRYIKCGANKETFYSRGTWTTLDSEVSEKFHTYGAWWKNPNEVLFYADNRLFDTVLFRTDINDRPFDRPMHVNMVTETYYWQPVPSIEEVTDTAKNYALYDWIRAYKLIPVNQKHSNDYGSDVFSDHVKAKLKMSGNRSYIECTYQLNGDKSVTFKVLNKTNEKVETILHKTLLAGYGNLIIDSNEISRLKSLNVLDIEIEY